MMALFSILISILSALITSALFIYGLVLLLRGPLKNVFNGHDFEKHPAHPLKLSRAKNNPLLPLGFHFWEAGGVMNPAAVRANGVTHLFYRAIGADGASRIGYASSSDGVNITERLPYPIFAIGNHDPKRKEFMRHHYPELLSSGGTWSGTEDPRAVIIDERVYLSFQSFEGWHSLRIGVVSLSLEDLEKRNWNWSLPMYLSAPNEVHKNWVLFPKKINGKYAVLHGFKSGDRSTALIDYVDSLDTDPESYIESDARFRTEIDDDAWDSQVRGAATPPIETEHGWLLLYHATSKDESHRYKIGALLLDSKDPSKVIARSLGPILEPDAHYENEGAKAGVVYACGATVEDDLLTVYYGGADTVVCAAATSLSSFLTKLVPEKITKPVV